MLHQYWDCKQARAARNLHTLNTAEGETGAQRGTYISEVEGDLQVGPEAVGEVRVHVQYLQQVVPQDLVQVTVRQSPHVCV